MATAEKIIAEQSITIDIDSVKPYRKNPRVGNVQAIAESLAENGQYRPIIVSKRTDEILGGNHTWKAAKSLGWAKIQAVYVDVDDKGAARIVLADNRTNDLATYNTDLLAEVLKTLDTPVGTGYNQEDYDNLVKALESQDTPQIEDIIRPPLPMGGVADDGSFEGVDAGGPPPTPDGEPTGWEDTPQDDSEDLNDQLGELQGILQLKEDMKFKSSNYYGIPDLNPKMLVDSLPPLLDTWAGEEATPDDGVTTWVWNYGVAPKRGLPFDRAILCFYTYDTYFESFWEQPAFMTAKVMNAGIKMAVVPDFSFYSDQSTAMHVFNTFRAQWLGRYFQEAGIRLIPRIQFGIGDGNKTLDFALMGIPKGSPVVACSIQNVNTDDEFKQEVANLKEAVDKVQPGTLLVYGGNPALKVLEAAKLKCPTKHIFNYAHKRRGVVFDKKEGLAAKRKDVKRTGRDKTSEPEPKGGTPKSIQAEEASL